MTGATTEKDHSAKEARDRRTSTARGTPRWAVVSAYVTVFCVVPSGLWRSAVGLGVPLGWSDAHLRLERIPGDGTAYVFSLTALTIAASLLTLVLVYPWGEMVPRWIPALGGRRIPPLVVVIPAAAGALIVAVIAVLSILNWDNVSGFADNPTSGWAIFMASCYAPALLWAPLLVAVTVAYWRRRSGTAGGQPQMASVGSST